MQPLKGSRRDDFNLQSWVNFVEISRVEIKWVLWKTRSERARFACQQCLSRFSLPFALSSRPFIPLFSPLASCIPRQLTSLSVRKVIIEPLDESVPTDSIDLVDVSFEEAIERGIDLVDIPLGETIEHRSVDLVEITWPYVHRAESPTIMSYNSMLCIYLWDVTCLFKHFAFQLDVI